MHQDLRALAEETSPEKRIELLRRLSEMYFEEIESHSDAEHYLFGEIVDKIVDSIDKPHKVMLSQMMAPRPEFPRAAAVRLAGDSDIDVAGPVIAQSPVLTDDDLAKIAGDGSQDHLHALAGRPHLPEAVTDLLVDRGDEKVVHAVSANHGAQFSQDGMNSLLERARADVDLRALLVERPDLSCGAVSKLLPLISANLVVRLAERGHDVGDALPPDMLATVSRRLTEVLRERRHNIRDTATLVEAVRAGESSLDETALQLAQTGRLVDLSVLLSMAANVDRDYLFGLISRGQTQAVMILFRALGLGWATLEQVLALRATKRKDAKPLGPDDRASYEAISPAVAQRTLRFSHVRRAAAC